MLTGALIGSGIPEYEVRRYEEGLKKGHALISVVAHSDNEIESAKGIFEKDGGTDIATAA